MKRQITVGYSQTLLTTLGLLLVLFAAVLLSSCNQNPEGDSVKLDAALEDVLPKIVLVVPDEQDKDGKPLEITVGGNFKGKAEYLISGGETHGLEYRLLNEHVVEGNKFVFTVVSYNLGGSGTFYYLTAIDKSTLKSVDEVLLGDREKISSLALETPKTDTVTINYIDRESGTAFTESPDKNETKHFGMDRSKLSQFWIEKLE